MLEQLQISLKDALEKLQLPSDNIKIIKSNRPDLCDYQYDGAFKLAKLMHKNPLEIGESITEELKQGPYKEYYQNISCIAPGFVNLTLSNKFIIDQIKLMITKPKYNITMPKKETIVIDYGGANVAKPLHVGHLRPAIVGESIKRILKYMNQSVISDVHLGDYGLQMGQVIKGLLEQNIAISNIDIKLLDNLYPLMSSRCKIDEELKKECSMITKELQDGNELYQKYFQKILEVSKKDIKRIYDYLNVSFDLWNGESDSYKYIPSLTNELLANNLLKESNHAMVIDVSKDDDKLQIPPLIYQASNKAYLYGTTDLATIFARQQNYHPNKILYVVDMRQNLHFTQVFRASQKLPSTKNIELEFLGFGTINGEDKKPFKTRSGNTPKLDALFKEAKEIFIKQKEENKNLSDQDLDKIVNAIIKFADLINQKEKDYIFDLLKFSLVNGKTGPYILYTYLRVKKIIPNITQTVDNLKENIYNEQDRDIYIKLLDLDNIMQNAFLGRSPSSIANYLYELCVLLNAFYEKNHMNNLEDKEKKVNWSHLLNLATNIIETLLDLLDIQIPSKM